MKLRRKKPATIIDIAGRLGLSAMTVSRALRGPEAGASEATRKRVMACAAKLGYQPNRWARSLVQSRSSMVGIIIPDISHAYFAAITNGIERVLEEAGYNILLCHSRNNPEREASEIAMLLGTRADGLIVAPARPPRDPGPFLDIRRRRVPLVLIDRFFTGQPFPCARTDDRAVGRLAARHLAGLGHRRIGFIGGPALSTALLRRRGFLDELRASSLAPPAAWIASGNFEIDGGRRAMSAILASLPRPTAIFCANDPVALGAVYTAREAGLRVPEDISIMGAGNIEGPHHPNPYLTTIEWPQEELGRAAARLLLDAIGRARSAAAPASELFPPRLLIRQTTAPPR